MTWFVGIDQSLGGFAMAFFDPTLTKPRLHRHAFPAAKFGNGIDRLVCVEKWVMDVFRAAEEWNNSTVTHVAMEGYSRGSRNRREEAGELSAVVRRLLWQILPSPARYPTIVAPKQRALFATGDGNADKQQVMDAIRNKWDVEIANNDEADAYVLARMAYDIYRGHSDLPYERKVIARLTPHTEQRAA